MHFTESLVVLRFVFCAAYASIPMVGLAVSWLVCKPRRPSLFIWPAISICLIGLPGQFSFHSEATMAVTLLWPALLALLVVAPARDFPWVAVASIAAACSHPYAAVVMAFIVIIAIVCVIVRPESRRTSLAFAITLGVLLLARSLIRLDPYEGRAFHFHTIVISLQDSVIGWPLLGILFALAAAAYLTSARSPTPVILLALLGLAGACLVVWACQPADWARCNDYRYWDAPVSLLLMAGATFEELWPSRFSEEQLQNVRLYAPPLIATIFLLVLSIQSIQWAKLSDGLANDLANSERGCIARKAVPSIKNTAMDYWPLGFYAVETQSRTPKTLLLEHNFSCHLFAIDGDAMFVDRGAFTYVRHRGDGWFDFEGARSQMRKKRQ